MITWNFIQTFLSVPKGQLNSAQWQRLGIIDS